MRFSCFWLPNFNGSRAAEYNELSLELDTKAVLSRWGSFEGPNVRDTLVERCRWSSFVALATATTATSDEFDKPSRAPIFVQTQHPSTVVLLLTTNSEIILRPQLLLKYFDKHEKREVKTSVTFRDKDHCENRYIWDMHETNQLFWKVSVKIHA